MPELPGKFDFITDDNFRDNLRRDYVEMESSTANNNWKVTLILAGSIVEAVLVDTLLASNYQAKSNKDLLKMELGDLINCARAEGILTQRVSELASVVRDYRNLIHPGKVVRTQDQPDQQAGSVARSLVDMILKEVSAKRQATQGITAEQLCAKLEIDPGAAKLIKHHTRNMLTSELRKFLISAAPDRYFKLRETAARSADAIEASDAEFSAAAIVEAHRSILEQVEPTIRRSAAQAFITVLKDGTEDRVREYANAFFFASDLAYLDDPDRTFAKDYMLSRINTFIDPSLLRNCKELPRFLSVKEINELVDILVRTLFAESTPDELKQQIEHYFTFDAPVIVINNEDSISARLKKRIAIYGSTEKGKIIKSLIEGREMFSL